jgi:hypothetical protein
MRQFIVICGIAKFILKNVGYLKARTSRTCLPSKHLLASRSKDYIGHQ